MRTTKPKLPSPEQEIIDSTNRALTLAELALQLSGGAWRDATDTHAKMKFGDLQGSLRAAVNSLEGALNIFAIHKSMEKKPQKTKRK